MTNANGVQVTVTPDALTTLVGGSFRTSPLALPDAYACTGNVPISVPAGSGLKANDFDDNLAGATITAVTNAATTQGGSITIAADGSFSYTPPVNFNGTDTYTYTLNDGNAVSGVTATDMATVTITVSNLIWFIDNSSVAATEDGRLNTPFKSIANFSASALPAAGQVIFLKNTGTSYNGGFILKNNQYLFGSGHSGGTNLADAGVLPFTVAPNSFTLPAINGSRPIIRNQGLTTGTANQTGIVLASGNTIRGVEVGRCGVVKISGANFGTLTIGNTTTPDVALSGNVHTLNLNNGAFAATSKFASINSPDSSSLILNTVSGSLASASTTVTANGSGGSTTINIQNSSAALDFGSTVVNNSNGGTCVSITNSGTGSVTFSNLSMTNAGNGTGLLASSGGTINIGGTSSAITARRALDITSTSFGAGATFASITSNSFSGKAVNLDNVSGPLTINGGSIAASTFFAGGIAFDVNGGSSNITYAGSITYPSPSADRVVEVTGRTGGTVTFSGTINATSGTGINVASNTGGTVNFSGNSKTLSTGANAAVTLATNTGATVNFTNGGLAITTTSGTGFNATGGGTVTVQGTGNTISSTSGATALNVVNTTIGASGLTFQSISSNGGSTTGIILNNTGTSGGLTVTGTGTAGSGGTIANKTGSDGSSTTATAISLTSCSSVSLTRMQINDCQNYGIRGSSVTNLTLSNCVFNGNLGTNSSPNPNREGCVFIENLLGSCAFTGTSFSGGSAHCIYLENNTGSLNRLTMTSCTVSSARTGSDDAFQFRISSGTPTMNLTLNTCTFTSSASDMVQLVGDGGGSMDLVVTGCNFSNSFPGLISGVLNILMNVGVPGTSMTATYDINNNTFQPRGVFLLNNHATTMSGKVMNNSFGVSGQSGSGGSNNSMSIIAAARGNNASHTTQIANNTCLQYDGGGIMVEASQGTGQTLNATVTGNTTAEPTSNAAQGFYLQLGGGGSPSGTACLSLTGNNFSAGSPAGGIADIVTDVFATYTLRLPGFAGPFTNAGVDAHLIANNPMGGTTSSTTIFAGASVTGGAACNLP